MRTRMITFFFCLILCGLWIHPALSDVTITKIVDSDSLIPGQEETPFGHFSVPVIDNGKVAFTSYNDGSQGIYLFANDTISPIIVSSNNGYYIYPWQWEFDNFTGFSDPVIKNDKIVFVGFNSSSIKYTLCLADLSQSSPIDTLLSASPFSPISGTGITTISGISFDGENISFLGTERINNFPYTPNGIFLYNSGGLHTLVDLTTPVPGQSNTFVEFGNSLAAGYPAISDGKLSFIGKDTSGKVGAYTYENYAVKKIIDSSEFIPGTQTAFGHIDYLSRDGNNTTCVLDSALCFYNGNERYTLPDNNTEVPGHPSLYFDSIVTNSIDNGNIAFIGYFSGSYGLYVYRNGIVEKICEAGDELDGKIIRFMSISRDCLSGNQMVFHIYFWGDNYSYPGPEALYMATLSAEEQTILQDDFSSALSEDYSLVHNQGTGSIDIAFDEDNPVLKIADSAGNPATLTIPVETSQELVTVNFKYRFNTSGKLQIFINDRLWDAIVSPESGPGREDFAEYNATLYPASLYITNNPWTLSLKLSNIGDPEIYLDDITITTTNTTPSGDLTDAVDDQATTNEDESIDINILQNDSYFEFFEIFIVSAPSHGTFDNRTDGVLTYAPTKDFYGVDSFQYRVTTQEGGSDIASVNITIASVNDSPSILTLSVPIEPIPIGQPVNILTEFNDPDPEDSFQWEVAWGDGFTTNGAITDYSRTIIMSHIYSAPGLYTPSITIEDAAESKTSASSDLVVVYDPNGAFVTGGGWILSPPGAYTPDPSLTGKATFGFVAKYKKGATVPDGNTEFQFKAGNLNFKSTSYDWLVVAGSKAQFKGVGTINGNGLYGFKLTAADGQCNGGNGIDKIRIKIWDIAANGIIYDNQLDASETDDPTTRLEGGNIVIHKK